MQPCALHHAFDALIAHVLMSEFHIAATFGNIDTPNTEDKLVLQLTLVAQNIEYKLVLQLTTVSV